MQYNQPFDQPSNPNASYVNGNPGAGISGSIPPAAAIEYPQREIVAVEVAAGLTPANQTPATGANQLLQAIQNIDVCNVLKISTNTGTAQAWAGTIPTLPNQAPLSVGTMAWFKPGAQSVAGGTTFALNGLSPAAVTLSDGASALQLGDVPSSATWCLLFWTGSVWLLLAGAARLPGQIAVLQANATWYVNGNTGSDTLYDGTSATVSGSHGPFATIQHAINMTLLFNMNGYEQTIYVADYATGYGPISLPQTNGAGAVNLIGNIANPQNCPIAATQEYQNAVFQAAGIYSMTGFRLSTASNGLDGFALSGGTMSIGNLRFGPCGRAHMSGSWSGQVSQDSGTITIEAGANAQSHMLTGSGATINFPTAPVAPPALVVEGAVTFSQAFAWANGGGILMEYSSITNGGDVTGAKYFAEGLGFVSAFGNGAGYFPGSTAGSTATGGVFGG